MVIYLKLKPYYSDNIYKEVEFKELQINIICKIKIIKEYRYFSAEETVFIKVKYR
jgi:hypothetical protein